MKVIIKDILADPSGIRVQFECACGEGIGFWDGPDPIVGDERFVELLLRSPITARALVETREAQGISLKERSCVLIGTIADAHNRELRVEFGCGGVDVELTDKTSIRPGTYMLVTSDLKLFDMNL